MRSPNAWTLSRLISHTTPPSRSRRPNWKEPVVGVNSWSQMVRRMQRLLQRLHPHFCLVDLSYNGEWLSVCIFVLWYTTSLTNIVSGKIFFAIVPCSCITSHVYVHCAMGIQATWNAVGQIVATMDTVEKEANKKYDQMTNNHKKDIEANPQVRRMTNELEDSTWYCYTHKTNMYRVVWWLSSGFSICTSAHT